MATLARSAARWIGALAVGLFAVAGCATPTAEESAQSPSAVRFSQQRIEENRFLVTVRGNFATRRDRVEQLLLYRAAELTLNHGYDYFVLSARRSDAQSRLEPFGGSNFGIGLSWYSPRWGWALWDDPIWGAAPSYRQATRFEAVADVAMFKGAKPAADANAYDARAVKENLTPPVASPRER